MDRTRRTRTELVRRVAVLAAVNMAALGSLSAPVIVGIPLAVDAVVPAESRAVALGGLIALGGLTALLTNPVFGALSDRTRGLLGRRRPWLLGGAAIGIVGVGGLGTAETLPAIAVWWVVVQASYNAMLAAAAGLLADVVPARARGGASGAFTASAFLGVLPPLLLVAALPTHVGAVSFVMPAAAVVVAGLALTLPDRAPARAARHAPATPTPRHGGGRWELPPAFGAIWLQRFAMQSAASLATAFTLYLVADRMTDDAVVGAPVAATVTLVGGGAIVVGAAGAGWWTSRRGGSLALLVLGAVGLATGAGLRAVAVAPAMLWAAAAVGGLATGAYLAVNFALALRAVPSESAGGWLGVLNGAETLPQVLAPLAAAALLRIGTGDPLSDAGDNYLALYATAALLAMTSLATIPALVPLARRMPPRIIPPAAPSGR